MVITLRSLDKSQSYYKNKFLTLRFSKLYSEKKKISELLKNNGNNSEISIQMSELVKKRLQ